MAPSGLIFVVIIAIWAAYFLQYWVRRREHLSTARSMDRFSESMRVLQRRTALPHTDLARPTSGSYAVAPARPVRPQILVKRAVDHDRAITAPTASADRVGLAAPASSGRRAAPAGTPPRAGRPVRAVGPSRRTRGVTLLAAVVVLGDLVAFAAYGVVSPVLVPLGLIAVAVAFAWLRAGVRADRSARRAARRDQAHPRPRVTAPPQPAAPDENATDTAYSAASDTADETAPDTAYDIDAVTARLRGTPAPATAPAAASAPARPAAFGEVDEDDIPLTWNPVPVPRPTYTMKDRAEHARPAPAEVTPTPERVEEARPMPVRRAAGA